MQLVRPSCAMMRSGLWFLLLAMVVACWTAASTSLGASDALGPYAIVNVAVIDLVQGIAVPGQTVVVVGNRIEHMGPTGEVSLPEGARVIDGHGLCLMPGLVDAHVHFLDAPVFGRLMVANGVTLVRDTGMPTDYILKVRDDLNRGELLGPEMVATGAILDGDPPLIPALSIAVRTPEEGRAAVRRQTGAGVDMIKVYSRLEADALLAIVDEAHTLGLKVIGHVPDSTSVQDAAAAGLDSSEHLFGFDKLVGRLLGAPVRFSYASMGTDVVCFLRLGEVDPLALQSALDDLRQSGLTVCPTVVTFKASVHTSMFQSGDFPEREYISQSVLETWRTLWAAQSDLPDFVWQKWAELVRGLNEAGVPLMAGTDLCVPGVIPGFSLHEELSIWQDAGIPPADILRSATLVPAQFVGLGERLGSLAEGKTASMVLLRANPLLDVRNTSEIEAVFLRGRYFDRETLDGFLDEARALAKG